jgi:Fe2+ transport system protein FeoA
MATSLAEIPLGHAAKVCAIDGPRAFRRRLLEMGLVPGTIVRVVTIAPLGDPLRIEVRHGQWSIRRAEAARISIEPVDPTKALAQVALVALVANASSPTTAASSDETRVASPTAGSSEPRAAISATVDDPPVSGELRLTTTERR